MTGRYRTLIVFLLFSLSVLPMALRAQGYHLSDRPPYHAASVYYVTLQNAAGESVNSQYSDIDGAIGAFVGNELRGVSEWQKTTAGKGVFVIRVWGDGTDDATASFCIYDNKGLEYQIGSQPFGKDQENTYGTPSNPIALTINPVTGISLPFKEITLKQNETYSVQPTLLPADHSILLTKLKYEYSSDAAAFSVSANGMITAVALGQGKITVKATPGNFTAQATVKVEAGIPYVPVIEIKNNMESNTIELQEGNSLQLDYSVLPDNATNKVVTFKNNYDIVDILQDTETSPATIIAKKVGRDTLIISSDDNPKATLTYYITVTEKPVEVIHVTKIEITPTTLDAYVGEVYNYTLKVLPENATNKEIEVSIENTDVISVDENKQQITAKAIGTTNIVFKSKDEPSIQATITVKVSAVPEVIMSFESQELTASKLHDIVVTLTKQGTATFLPSRVELVFPKVSNGEPVATATMADETGLKWTVRGQYVGKHTVKIKYNGKEQTSTCTLNIPGEIAFRNGWDWISLYTATDCPLTNNAGEFLSSLNTNDKNRIIEIRSQKASVLYDPSYGFFGDLTKLTAEDGAYKVKSTYEAANDATKVFNIGTTAGGSNVAAMMPQVETGYTWIGYPHERNHKLSTLQERLSATASNGDMIIGRDAFLEFNGVAWQGSLKTFEAGKGYIYYTKAAKPFRLDWGDYYMASDTEEDVASRAIGSIAVLPWHYDAFKYASSMPVVARLADGFSTMNMAVGAFVNGECRGYAISDSEGWLFLSVTGNPGESVNFMLFDASSGLCYDVEATVVFGSPKGSLRTPMIFGNNASGIGFVQTEPLSITFNGTDIRVSGASTEQPLIISVYNMTGRNVLTTAGHNSVNLGQLAKGIYTVKANCGRLAATIKIAK